MSLNDIPEEIFAIIGKLLTSHDVEGVMSKITEVEASLSEKLVEVGKVKGEITHLLNFSEEISIPASAVVVEPPVVLQG